MKPIKAQNKQQNIKIGRLGEDIALKYLESKGFALIQQNYRKPYAEIDIICRKDGRVHFVEVKTVSYETKSQLKYAVTHETWRPEEQVHAFKLKQISKGVETWLHEKKYNGTFQIDVITVRVVPHETYATVKMIPNVIIE
jgi:putative endonuclease